MANNVRAALLSDVQVLVELMEEFYRESNYSLERLWATNSFRTLLGDSSRGSVWLLSRDNEAVGYVVLTVRFSMEHGGLDAFIDDLFVRREHRRRGVATTALDELFAECRRRGVLALHVEVGRDNVGANTLYAGFSLRARTDHRQLLTVALPLKNAGA
jgi:ribosomal protein S18 acetylase RimI-like enzyme